MPAAAATHRKNEVQEDDKEDGKEEVEWSYFFLFSKKQRNMKKVEKK